MNAFRFLFCAATLCALVAVSEDVASQEACLRNHYILDYPCGVQAGTAPPSFQIPQVPAGVNHWSAIGPDGANVVALVIDPVVPAIAFAGTVGSGILKTTDGGANWAIAGAGLPTGNVLALAIDPVTHSTLYAGTDAGIFKSTDGGQTWVAASGGLDGAPSIVVNALAIDPGSPTTLYAGTSAGVFKTTNGAASWTSINAGLSGLAARVIAVDPTASSTVYIAADDKRNLVNNGVFKSTDGGTSWVEIFTAPDPDVPPPITALAIDPRSPARLYLVVGFTQVLTSPDGVSWSDLKVPAGDVWSLAVDPTSPGTIYVGTDGGLVFRTTDDGEDWTKVSDGEHTSSVHVIATAASAPGTVYAGGHNGVSRSLDSAQTWTQLTLGVRDVGVSSLTVDPTASSTIYAVTGGVIMKTTDGGAHWVDSNIDLFGAWATLLTIDPVSPSIMYATQSPVIYDVASSVIYKSTDAGAHWTFVDGGVGLGILSIAPTEPSILYAGVSSGTGLSSTAVLKSTDGGTSWAPSHLSSMVGVVSALAVDPTTADTVYAVVSPASPAPEIFKSTDGGDHWSELQIDVLFGTCICEITSLLIDPATPSTIYAAYSNYSYRMPAQGGVLKSSDGGETWVAASQGLPVAAVSKLVSGAGFPAQIYAGTDAGVFTSTDGAASWTPLNTGLPDVPVLDLSVDRTGSVLRAATTVGLFEYRFSAAAPSGTVAVIEYYHAGFGDYFITANPDEIASLDGGVMAGWVRTGLQFNAYSANAGGTAPVCRFFSTAFAPKSPHFYTPFPSECTALQANPDWLLESGAAFYIAIPAADGSCAAGLTPVYRLYNNSQGGAPNHRYTTDAAARAQMIEQGWVSEGIGPDAVEMCAPQ
jgi:photosystem II stability/assembly factor-like uncharacterized protein